MNPSLSARRSHRSRLSTLRLSSDTSASLPAYNDLPPDYPDVDIDADDPSDTDVDNDLSHDRKSDIYTPPSTTRNRSRPHRRPPLAHRRGSSFPSSDQYLDSLLERSVHALEMSNALLLHSSLSNQPTLSATISSDATNADQDLEARAHGLSPRIRANKGVHDNWIDDLDHIRRGVEGLFDDDKRDDDDDDEGNELRRPPATISASLPTSSSMPTSHLAARRRLIHRNSSSLDVSDPDLPHLQLSHLRDRSQLISPPPRAITQYVASSTDADLILLPSTIGLRGQSSSSHLASPPSESCSPQSQSTALHSSTNCSSEPSTPAIDMLSSVISRSTSTIALSPPALGSSLTRRRSGSATVSTSTSSVRDRFRSRPRTTPTSPEQTFSRSSHCASSHTHAQPPSPVTRTTSLPPTRRCPPIQELSSSPSPSPSCSSDDSCPAKLTVQSLRKILDEQPVITVKNAAPTSPDKTVLPKRAPAFLPRSPPPAPASGTSTATASISRLFTKATHSSSTHPPSPPRHSSLKQAHQRHPSGLDSPASVSTPSPTKMAFTKSLPDLLGIGLGFGSGSGTSSGRSTPKRISFAELPESSRGSGRGGDGEGGSGSGSGGSKLGGGKRRRVDVDAAGGARRTARKRSSGGSGGGGSGNESWWATWLLGAASAPAPVGAPFGGMGGPSAGALMQEERGKVSMGSGMDGWAI